MVIAMNDIYVLNLYCYFYTIRIFLNALSTPTPKMLSIDVHECAKRINTLLISELELFYTIFKAVSY